MPQLIRPLFLKEEYFSDIGAAGFDSVRVPIRWSKYANVNPPYEIQQVIFDRVDWVIEQAFANNLAVVINIHHYDAMMQMPEIQKERFTAIWRQIAEHYQDYPETLYFEILNEPHEKLDAAIWNETYPQALAVIRDPEAFVTSAHERQFGAYLEDCQNVLSSFLRGLSGRNNINRVPTLVLPEDDRRIIVTFQYYLPHEFTHQGASWSSAADVKDLPWGSDEDIQNLTTDFDTVSAWAEEHQRPLFMGEFGSIHYATEDSRAIWTATIRNEAEKRGFSWAYWDFGTDFAVYNLANKTWREPILNALIPGE